MRSFTCVLAAAAIASLTIAAPVDCSMTTRSSEDDCNAFPEWAEVVENMGTGFDWELVSVETSDGYLLNLIHMTGGTGTPILLNHGVYGDATNWILANDFALPERLNSLGFDVWFTNLRGTQPSRGHSTLDVDSAEYWNWDLSAFSTYDLPASIATVMASRDGAGEDCKKVQVVSYGFGSQFTNVMLSEYADTAGNYVERAVNIAPCHILATQEETEAAEAGGDDRLLSAGGRQLWHYSYWSHYYHYHSHDYPCDRTEYYAELRRIKYDIGLNYWQYREFYNRLSYASYYKSSDWYCGDYMDDVVNALCAVDHTQPECRPTEHGALLDGFKLLRDECGAQSVFGPTFWDVQVPCICEDERDENVDDFCAKMAAAEQFEVDSNRIPFNYKETSIDAYLHHLQQSILQKNSKFNPDFCTNGWFADPELYDYSNITTQVNSQFFMSDAFCPMASNAEVESTVSSQMSTLTYKDGRVHWPWITVDDINEDERVWKSIYADLTENPSDGDCAAADFGTW